MVQFGGRVDPDAIRNLDYAYLQQQPLLIPMEEDPGSGSDSDSDDELEEDGPEFDIYFTLEGDKQGIVPYEARAFHFFSPTCSKYIPS